jgi:hypothetical protein
VRGPAGRAALLCLLVSVALVGSFSSTARAAPAGVETAQRSYTQRSLTKVRSGSYLATNTVLDSHPELRSDLELQRDAELEKHYGRLGQLDAVMESATKAQSLALLETVEITWRNETQRFNAAMQGLRLLRPASSHAHLKADTKLIYRRAVDKMRRQVSGGQHAATLALEEIDAQLEREKELLQ